MPKLSLRFSGNLVDMHMPGFVLYLTIERAEYNAAHRGWRLEFLELFQPISWLVGHAGQLIGQSQPALGLLQHRLLDRRTSLATTTGFDRSSNEVSRIQTLIRRYRVAVDRFSDSINRSLHAACSHTDYRGELTA
jgi:hypothetical protein